MAIPLSLQTTKDNGHNYDNLHGVFLSSLLLTMSGDGKQGHLLQQGHPPYCHILQLIVNVQEVVIKYRKSGNFHCKNIFVVNGSYEINLTKMHVHYQH